MTETPVISEVVAAGLIMHVRVVNEDFGPWEMGDDGSARRSGTVEVQVVEVFKGYLSTAADDTVRLDIVVRGSPSGRVSDYQGIWAHVSTAPGSELIAFCDDVSDLRVALTDDHCDALMPAESVLSDVRLVTELDSQSLGPEALLDAASQYRAEGGDVFARYIWVQIRDWVIASSERFDALMEIAVDPQTRTIAQEVYLVAAYEDATFTEELPPEQRVTLARSMFRAVLDEESVELREPLLDTFIPNLVEAEVPEPLSTAEVFDDEPGLAERVLADEADPQTSAYGESLSAWLSGERGA